MTVAPAAQKHLRIGVVVTGGVRVEGLLTMLSAIAELIPLTAHEAVREPNLTMVLLDAGDHLFAMMATFRRARAGLRIIVLGDIGDPAYIARVVAAGAKGYLLHTASPREIETAVEVVADGSIWAPRKVLAGLIDTYSPNDQRRRAIRFTPREQDVLRLLVDGQADREIAARLELSARTVQCVVAGLLRKVGAENRVALTVRVLEQYSFR